MQNLVIVNDVFLFSIFDTSIVLLNFRTPTSEVLDRPDLWEPFNNGNQLQIGGINDKKDTTVQRLQCCNNDRMNFWRRNAPI